MTLSRQTLVFRVMRIASLTLTEPQDGFRLRNHYRCPSDGTEWVDEWDCACNDRCPVCQDEIQPYHSEDIGASFNSNDEPPVQN